MAATIQPLAVAAARAGLTQALGSNIRTLANAGTKVHVQLRPLRFFISIRAAHLRWQGYPWLQADRVSHMLGEQP